MVIKFQSGGSVMPPFAVYQPISFDGNLSAKSSQQTSSSSDDEKGKLTEKDIFTMLKEIDGLPSDMMALEQEFLRLFSGNDWASSGFGGTSSLASNYIKALTKLKTANFNLAQFKKAQDTVVANGGINEVAIDSRGMLYCYNSNTHDFKLVRPEELQENEGYIPMTNAELLSYRALSGAFANDITDIVGQGIGMKSVTDMIQDVINKLGHSLNTLHGYGAVRAGEVLTGILDYQKAVLQAVSDGYSYDITTQDLYKYKYLTQNLAQQAQMAIEYLYRSMPENYKSLLKVKSGQGNDNGAKLLMGQLVTSSISDTTEFDFDAIAGKTAKLKAASANASAADKRQITPAELWYMGGGNVETFVLNQGTSYATAVKGNTMAITKNGDDKLGTITLDKVATSDYGGILDWKNASFGGVIIDNNLQGRVTVDSTAITKVILPLDKTQKGGVKIPDQTYLQKLSEIKKTLQKKGINLDNPEDLKLYELEINAIFVSQQLPVLVKDGELNLTDYCEFGVINGKASSQALRGEVPEWTKEIDDVETIRAFDSLLKRNDKDYSRNNNWFLPVIFGGKDSIYEGTIYIPVIPHVTNAGTKMTAEQWYETEKLQEQSDNINATLNNIKEGNNYFN